MCPITDELMETPVILSSGHTYEKSAIVSHFKVNGPTDPLTRETVDPNILIVNRGLKQAISDFFKHNPWAYRHVPG